jgi:phage baseplate assembly protein V
MELSDLRRWIDPIKKKVYLMLGRAILTAINNSGTTQRLQMKGLSDEVLDGVERFQEYGFDSYPWEDAQAAVMYLGGNRDHGIVVTVHDRRYRPTNLTQGEIVLYTDEDKVTEFRVWLKRNRILYARANNIDLNSDTEASLVCPQIALGDEWASVRKLIDERFQALFNAHVHSGIFPGNDTTGAPTTAITNDHMTDKTRAV